MRYKKTRIRCYWTESHVLTKEDCYHKDYLRVSANPLASFCCQIFKLIIVDQSVFSALMAWHGTGLMVYSVGSHSFWLRQILYLRPCYNFFFVSHFLFVVWCLKVYMSPAYVFFFWNNMQHLWLVQHALVEVCWLKGNWGIHDPFHFFMGEATKMFVKKWVLNRFTPPLCFSQEI